MGALAGQLIFTRNRAVVRPASTPALMYLHCLPRQSRTHLPLTLIACQRRTSYLHSRHLPDRRS